MEFSFGGVFAVSVIALGAPLLSRSVPRLRVPAVALEILLGMLVGPILGWVHMDTPLDVFGEVGLAFLLFLGGLEIDLGALHGRVARILSSWGLSCIIALAFAYAIFRIDGHDGALVLAIALSSTSLGLVVPVLREERETGTPFGRTLLGSSSVAEFGSLVLLSIFFSTTGASPGTEIFLLCVFAVAVVLGGLTLARVTMRTRLLSTLDSLADTSSQMRVRGIMVVLFGFVAVASTLGFEAILGSFAAGVLLRYLDRDHRLDEPKLKNKIDALGYGFLVPMFFVTSGIKIDINALASSPRHMMLVPLLVLAMIAIRGVPAVLYRRWFDMRHVYAAGFLSATNLSFMVIVATVGTELGDLDAPSAAAMVLAGVASVVLFPPIAISFLPGDPPLEADWDELGMS